MIKTGTYISAAEVSRGDRIRRLESLAWLLDNSIMLPGGYRIGLDALIGLIPGLGDAVGALISAFIINENLSQNVASEGSLRSAARRNRSL